VFVDLVQNTLDGLMLGSAYALLALGFTLIFGVLRRANLSYGPAIMLGAYVATWVHLRFHAGFLVLAAVTIAGDSSSPHGLCSGDACWYQVRKSITPVLAASRPLWS